MRKIAIIGGGPAGLFMFKRLVENADKDFSIDIFEATGNLGRGMPYSTLGANEEHITNVSGNEIPWLMTSLKEWINAVSEETLRTHNLEKKDYSEFKVIPRLLFGDYLSAQFELYRAHARKSGLPLTIHLDAAATDIIDHPDDGTTMVQINNDTTFSFHQVIICTGHNWPKTHEGTVPGYFDSPYPPAKLKFHINHTVAIRGSSLTAIDAIRTMARFNGEFKRADNGTLQYFVNDDCPAFRIAMHSRNGLLPAIRFHLEDPRLQGTSLLTKEDIDLHRKTNNGFLSLDYIFEKDFKDSFIEKDKAFHDFIKDLSIEEFVERVLAAWHEHQPFELFQKEFDKATSSILLKESIFWKEALAILSFAINYPAKHFSAEDMLRLQKVLKPIISNVIAFVPQSSAEELLALHAAGRLSIMNTGDSARVAIIDQEIVYEHPGVPGNAGRKVYKTFVDCIGQPPLELKQFPFKSLVDNHTVTQATVPFQDHSTGAEMTNGNNKVKRSANGQFYLEVPGIAINDNFQIVDSSGAPNERIYLMAVPYIAGYNPDYSGLDFCEEASRLIMEKLFSQ